MLYTVSFVAIVSGSLDDFEPATYTARLAAYFNVSDADITLSVSPASVLVIANITATDMAVAEGTFQTLETISTTQMSEVLLLAVEAIEKPTLIATVLADSPPLLLSPPVEPHGRGGACRLRRGGLEGLSQICRVEEVEGVEEAKSSPV